MNPTFRMLEYEMLSYIKWYNDDFFKLHDLITDYVENKNVKDETKKITKICNHLTDARKWYEKWKLLNAHTDYDIAYNSLLFIN